jgi:hypothetical protein
MLLKKLLCPPCRELCSQRLGSALGLPRWGWQRAYDSLHHPYRGHNGAWDEKSTEGDGANLVADGTAPGLGRLIPARTEWGVVLVRRQ